MARLHLGLEQERAALGHRTQPGDPLGGLVIGHPGVVQPGQREDRRVDLSGDVFIRRVRLHVRVDLGVVQRVAPLLPLGDGQRQRRVQDRGQRVHERHLRHDAREGLGGHVGDRAHQQPARRAAPRDEPVR